ncbi:MAG: hypothetical protein D6675_01055 [Gemmatimonadetes bacterium]|nr:MAG: hypothetical protein D6675_01055 [Gemmatimonadota bacterium]
MSEPHQTKSFFGLGCWGCAGVIMVSVVVAFLVVIGGLYWFVNYRLLQPQPYASNHPPELQIEAIQHLQEKINTLADPSPVDTLIVLHEDELNYLLHQALEQADFQDPKARESIKVFEVDLEGESVEGRISIQARDRFLNVRVKGKIEIDGQDLRIADLEVDTGALGLDAYNEVVRGRIQEEYNRMRSDDQMKTILDNIESITVEEGHAVIRIQHK